MIETLALISVSLMAGTQLGALLKGSAFELPTFVCVLFVGVLLRNILSLLRWHDVGEREVSLLGNVSLSLFLAIALMSSEVVATGLSGLTDDCSAGCSDNGYGSVCLFRDLPGDGAQL